MANTKKQKKDKGASDRITLRKEQVLMLRSQGYTIRQICDALKIKSKDTVHNDIKSVVSKSKGKAKFTPGEYREIELDRCAERSGRLAEWRDKIETMNLTPERQIQLILLIEDRDMKNQERLIKLLDLENHKVVEAVGCFNINDLRERKANVERKDREMKENPALSGVVR
jgi:DNA-binding transcriptional MerR regulator